MDREDTMVNGFGIALRNARRGAGITQRDLAARLGVDFTYISKMENGRLERPPAEATIRKLADEMGLGQDWFLSISGRTVEVSVKEAALIKRVPELKMELARTLDQLTHSQGRIAELEREVGRLMLIKEAADNLWFVDVSAEEGGASQVEVHEAKMAVVMAAVDYHDRRSELEQQPTTLTKEGGGGE